jgi:hypothetical protein
MAIRSSGPLPIAEIAQEFGGDTPHGLSEYYGNGVFLSPGYFPPTPVIPVSNAINIGVFYGKSKKVPVTVEITSNTSNVNAFDLFRSALTPYSSIDVDATLIVRAGVTVSGSLTIPPNTTDRSTGFRSTDDFTLINNGVIVGFNGTGGAGGSGPNGQGANGTSGSTPLQVRRLIAVINNGIIAGGSNGGRGGNGGTVSTPSTTASPCTSRPICNRYRFTQRPTFNCMQCRDCCDDARNMGVMHKWNGQCNCGTCDEGRGCRNSRHTGQQQQQQTCQQWGTQTTCSQSPITVVTSRNGGRGGDGAPPSNPNGAQSGSAGGGGTAQNGQAGTGWGAVAWVSGFSNIRGIVDGVLMGPTS